MLGTKTKPSAAVNGQTNGIPAGKDSGDTCVVSIGTTIEGIFTSSENVRLDGVLKGQIKCDKRLVMGEQGKVEGKISTVDAVVMGTIDGELKASGTLTLKSTGLIKGTIAAKYMIVEEGARYFGNCHIG